jgi:signal transduction histidine kinase/CheY-like chemotaxis protein
MLRRQILILCLVFCKICFSQNERAFVVSDTLNSDELIRLAEQNRQSNAFASAIYAEKAIREGKRHNNFSSVIRGNLILGRLQEEKNRTAEAYKFYQEALKSAVDIKDSNLISVCYQSIGAIYKRLELFPKSLEYLSKALQYSFANKENPGQTVTCYNVSGHVCMDWFERTHNKMHFEAAIKNYETGLNISKYHNLESFINNGYVNLANAYMLYYQQFGEIKEIYKSIKLSYSGINYSIEKKHPEWMPIHYLNVGEAYFSCNNIDSAIIYYGRALKLYEKENNKAWFETVKRDLAMAYKVKGDYDKALKYILEAINDANSFRASAPADDYRILSEVYNLKQNYIGALDAFKKYKEIENLDMNLKRTLQLEKLQVEYENNLKDEEIRFLNQKKVTAEEKLSRNRLVILLIIISLVLLVLVCVFLIIHSRNLRRSKQLSDNARLMQEQFLANTSHEIRTPMNGIQGMVNLLLQSPLNENQKLQLETINTSSNHLLRIINDLLDLSKIKAGKIEFVRNNFKVETIVSLIRELMQPSAESKGLTLKYKIEESAAGYYYGDDMRLEQILINIISNAIKYTEKGEISLSVYAQKINDLEHRLCFRITDSGIGIPKKKMGAIFDSFVQLENAGRRKQGGVGLGLAITKQLIELQDGDISVNSAVGKGSEFLFRIPYKVADAETAQSVTKSLPLKRDLSGKRILVVEDNEINQRVILNTLKSWQAECSIVSSAVEGFDVIMHNTFDLILMDIELPVINGWDATQYIRMKFDEPRKSTPIIALTAYASEDDKNKCYASGMNDIVTKPFNSEELYIKIHNLLFNRQDKMKSTESSNLTSETAFKELEEKYSDDKSGLLEIYGLFLSELPIYLDELKALNAISNVEGIKKQAHKMKSPLGLVGSTDLLSHLNDLQKNDVLSNEHLRKKHIEHIIKESERLEEEISERLKKLEIDLN